jgi:hypothetical protein
MIPQKLKPPLDLADKRFLVGSRGTITSRPSPLDLGVRLSPHPAPDVLGFRLAPVDMVMAAFMYG